jgi:hypothetical protein
MQYQPWLLEGFLASTGLDLAARRYPQKLKIVSYRLLNPMLGVCDEG